jgi:hypothetical protein
MIISLNSINRFVFVKATLECRRELLVTLWVRFFHPCFPSLQSTNLSNLNFISLPLERNRYIHITYQYRLKYKKKNVSKHDSFYVMKYRGYQWQSEKKVDMKRDELQRVQSQGRVQENYAEFYQRILFDDMVARIVWRLIYKTGIGLTTGFIGSHTVTHNYSVYTLTASQQLTLFSSSDDFGSNSATTAATSSHGVPCHHSLTGNCPRNSKLYSPWTDPKENTSPIPLLLEWRHYRNGPQRKRWSLSLLRCLATVINNVYTVDCWPTACMSQYQ